MDVLTKGMEFVRILYGSEYTDLVVILMFVCRDWLVSAIRLQLVRRRLAKLAVDSEKECSCLNLCNVVTSAYGVQKGSIKRLFSAASEPSSYFCVVPDE